MMNDNPSNDRVTPNSIPYPRNCADCGEQAVQRVAITYVAQLKHDGKLHEFPIPELLIDQCASCGEQYFTSTTNDQISSCLRAHVGLLQPEEIRHQLDVLKLTQRDFAGHLRVAPESVSRWLTGANLQSRSLDALMRVYFQIPAAREALKNSECLNVQPAKASGSRDVLIMPLGFVQAEASSPGTSEGLAARNAIPEYFKRRLPSDVISQSQRFTLIAYRERVA